MSPNPSTGTQLLGFLPLLLIIAIAIPPFWRIFRRLGFAPALSLLMIIPVANMAVLYFVAFSKNRGAGK